MSCMTQIMINIERKGLIKNWMAACKINFYLVYDKPWFIALQVITQIPVIILLWIVRQDWKGKADCFLHLNLPYCFIHLPFPRNLSPMQFRWKNALPVTGWSLVQIQPSACQYVDIHTHVATRATTKTKQRDYTRSIDGFLYTFFIS